MVIMILTAPRPYCSVPWTRSTAVRRGLCASPVHFACRSIRNKWLLRCLHLKGKSQLVRWTIMMALPSGSTACQCLRS